MNTLNIKSAKQKKDGSVELTIISDPLEGTTYVKRYSAIRGGISLPTSKSPAYFCVIGMEYVDPPVTADKVPPGRLILLDELKADSLALNDFYVRLIDIVEKMLCRDVYMEMTEERYNGGYQDDLINLARKRNTLIRPDSPYDVDGFILGLSRIKGSMNDSNLTIPADSIVYNQLKNITNPDLDNSPEEVFYAINGLRHVINSFFRVPPNIRNLSYEKMRNKMEAVSRRGGHMSA